MNTKKAPLLDPTVLMVVTIALLGIVIYAGNVMTVNTSEITDIICLVSFTFMPISGIVSAICFLIPLHSGITGLYIYGYAVAMILVKSRKFKVKMILPVIAIIVYEMIMMLFVKSSEFNYILIYALTVFLTFYMMNSEEVNPRTACIAYICGTFVLLLCIFTTSIQIYSFETVMSGTVRIGEYEGLENLGKIAVVTENANSTAYYSLVAIIMALNVLKTSKPFIKILLIAAILFMITVSLFTVSRTFVIMLSILLILSFLSAFNFKQKIIFLFVIVLILSIGLPFLKQNTQVFDAFTERFEDDDLSSGAGRSEIFGKYMQFLWDNPLRLVFGTGAVFYKNVCNIPNSMHNGTQQILVAYGVLGFIPVLSAFISPIFDYLKKNKFKFAKFLPVLAAVAFTQSIQFLNPFNLMLPYAIAIMCMKIPDSEEK